MTQQGAGAAARLRFALAELFSIDLRSLAVFRIALGAILLVDLGFRARFLGVHYTDAGAIPRALAADPTRFSLHALSGEAAFQGMLFAVAALFAALLLAGLATRVATFASWVLLLSLHYRVPGFQDGGDLLLRQLLFWSLFLPLGARFSLDARRGAPRPPGPSVLSPASVVLLLQFAVFFCLAGVYKTGPEWLTEGTAVQRALAQDYWATPLGAALREYPQLLRPLTPLVRYFEIFGPFLMFLPVWTGPVRVLTILAFAALMGGLGANIQLHLFPVVGTCAALPFLPAWFWERLPWRVAPVTAPLDGEGGADAERTTAWWRIGWLALPLAALVLWAAVANVRASGQASASALLRDTAASLGFKQRWRMYPRVHPWDLKLRVVGQLADGGEQPLLEVPGETHWPPLEALHRDYRHKYHLKKATLAPRAELLWSPYLAWLGREWNAAHGGSERLRELRAYVIETRTDPAIPPEARDTEPRLIARWRSPAP